MFGMVILGTMNLQDVLLVASSSVNTPIKRVLLLQTNDLEVVHLSRVIRSFVVREKKNRLVSHQQLHAGINMTWHKIKSKVSWTIYQREATVGTIQHVVQPERSYKLPIFSASRDAESSYLAQYCFCGTLKQTTCCNCVGRRLDNGADKTLSLG